MCARAQMNVRRIVILDLMQDKRGGTPRCWASGAGKGEMTPSPAVYNEQRLADAVGEDPA